MLLAECPKGWLSSDDVLQRVDTFLFKVKDVAAIGLASSLKLEEPQAIQAHVSASQDTPVAVAVPTRTPSNKELELDREECREIARLIRSGDPDRPTRTIAREISSGTHVVGKPCAWRAGKKSPDAVRKWIEKACPAPRTGRPRKNQ